MLWLKLIEVSKEAPGVSHDDVIKWRHFLRYWPFVQRIHRPPVNSPHQGQWRELWCLLWLASWINNREAGDLRRHHAHYDVIVMHFKTSGAHCNCKPFCRYNDCSRISSTCIFVALWARINGHCSCKLIWLFSYAWTMEYQLNFLMNVKWMF